MTLLGGAAAAWPLAAPAQQGARVRRVGILMPYPKGDSENEARVDAFKPEVAKLGGAEGRNIPFDEHRTTDEMDIARSHAAAGVASNPDIIVTTGGRVTPVFMRLTRSIRSPAQAIRSASAMRKAWRIPAATLPASLASSCRYSASRSKY